MENSNKETEKNNFFTRVYEVVAQIPEGKVISYGQIATLLGSPRSARQVGWALTVCPEELPWQRVVKTDGSITGGEYAEVRRNLLIEEGVEFLLDGCVDMDVYRWEPGSLSFLSNTPAMDEALQQEIAEEIASLEVS